MADVKYNNPLEIWFIKRLEKGEPATKNMQGYTEKYKTIKQYLMTNIAKWINPALAASDGYMYTDHGPDHFEEVIEYTGVLLGLETRSETPIEDQEIQINEYETFIILVAILLHDIGNIYGREDHEKRPFSILSKIKDSIGLHQVEVIIIARIAEAHGGTAKDKDGMEDKDTILRLIDKDIDSFKQNTFRPRALAALLRFADEVCECHGRGAKYMLEERLTNKENEIFHTYAESICNINVDLKSKAISIYFHLFTDKLCKQFKKKNKNGQLFDQYLIDEMNERLEKMFCELKYCARFMSQIVSLEVIKANIQIFEDNGYDVAQDKSFILSEYGYPTSLFSFKEKYPEWNGEAISNTIAKKDT